MAPVPLLAAVLALHVPVAAPAFSDEASDELKRGIRQVQDGDLEAALITLDGAVQRLTPLGRRDELARAHVYLGVAYLGLGQPGLATLKFRQAVRHQRDLRLSPDEFSARALRVFEAARDAEQRATRLQTEVRKSKSKGGLLVLGAGGAAAAALAVTLVRERANTPPTVSVAVSPAGTALVGATQITFTATASDHESDPLRYSWSFGDGGTASGHIAVRTYDRTATWPVRLSVSDGLDTAEASVSVVVGTIRGTWRPTSGVFLGITEFPVGGGLGETFSFRPVFPGGATSPFGSGLAIHPRTVLAGFVDPSQRCRFRFEGAADEALQRITGTLACEGSVPACACAGQQQDLTLVR